MVDKRGMKFGGGIGAWRTEAPRVEFSPLVRPDRGPAAAPAPPEAQDMLRAAVAAHRQGGLDAAARLYEQVLRVAPGLFDALHLLGVVRYQQGRHDDAVALIRRALEINPHSADAHSNLGNALHAQGRHEEALVGFERAVALRPDFAPAHNNRGNALQALGRPEEALNSFDRALALQPDLALAHRNRGFTLGALGRHGEALASFDAALRLEPDHAETRYNRGNALQALGRNEEAVARPQRATALRPDFSVAHTNLGNALAALGRHGEALANYERSLALDPNDAVTHNNRGAALQALDRFEEAIDSYRRAAALKPDYADAWSNCGWALAGLNQHRAALDCYARALAAAPGFAPAHWNEALARLCLGEFETGWQKHEWRWKNPTLSRPRRDPDRPLWTGQNVAGRTVLLHAEQGFGDTFQFVRYVPLLVERGARVVLDVQPPLKRLLERLPDVAVISDGDSPPAFDYHCPLLSLPLGFATRLDTIPARIPYLTAPAADVARWSARLGARPDRRVGLVWAGRPTHKNDRLRSLRLEQLAPLLSVSGTAFITFIALQKEIRPEDAERLGRHPALVNLGPELDDFADTAALVSLLDLVVTVDTSVAHLAGALGKPVWILLPFSPDWRWLLERDDSPWYPTARLFRQPRIGDWDGVIARVAQELSALVPRAAIDQGFA